MKTTTKFAIGIWIIILAGVFGLVSVGLFHVADYIVAIGFFISILIGTSLITANSVPMTNVTPIIELVPERLYKIIDHTTTNNGDYTTLKYQNVYGLTAIHTFKNVSFEKDEENSVIPGHEPNVGRVFIARKKEGSDILRLNYLQG